MLDQILQEHKPGDKPRFFLHDEMKAWLQDHLEVVIKTGVNRSPDNDTAERLGLKENIPAGFFISVDIKLDEEEITSAGRNVSLNEIALGMGSLSRVVETCMVHIQRLMEEVRVLQQRLDQLQKP